MTSFGFSSRAAANHLARAVHARTTQHKGDRILKAGLLERIAMRCVTVDGPDSSHQVELQADAEHEEDDADLGEFVCQLLVGDEAGRMRADDESRDEVPHDGREPQAERHVPADEGCGQPAGERQYQVDFVHRPSITGPERSSFPVWTPCIGSFIGT